MQVNALIAQREELRVREASARLAVRQVAELLQLGALLQEQQQQQQQQQQEQQQQEPPGAAVLAAAGFGLGAGGAGDAAGVLAPPELWRAQLLELQRELEAAGVSSGCCLLQSSATSSGSGGVSGSEPANASGSASHGSFGGGSSGASCGATCGPSSGASGSASGGAGPPIEGIPSGFSAAEAAAHAGTLAAEGALTTKGLRRIALEFVRTGALMLT